MCRVEAPDDLSPFRVWKRLRLRLRLRLGKHGILMEFQSVARHPMWWGWETPAEQNIHESYLHPVTSPGGGRPWLVMSTRLPAKTLDICQLSFSHDRWGYTIPSMDSSESPSATTYNACALGLLRQLIHSWPLTLWAFPQLDILQHADWFRQGHPLQ